MRPGTAIAMTHLLLIALLALPSGANAAVKLFNVTEPRSIGYSVGDIAKRTAHVELEKPWRLDEDRLPGTGTVDTWLELRSINVVTDRKWKSTAYSITFTYQILNAPEIIQEIFLPEQEIFFTHGADSLPLLMSRQALTLTPLLDAAKVQSGDFFRIEVARQPTSMDATAFQNRALVAGFLLFAALLGIAYIHFSVPFLKRSNGPFAKAYRHLKQLGKQPAAESRYADALKHVHAAFNETAGHIVFATELDRFFARNPRYASHRSGIDRFFAESHQHFFDRSTRPPTAEALNTLLDTCRTCRDIERGLN